MQNSYYKVMVPDEPYIGRTVCVFKKHEGNKQIISTYVSRSRWIYWIGFCLLLLIHSLLYYRLRRLFLYINRRGRHVSSQRKFNETVSALVIVIMGATLFGWYIHSYFFLGCPLVYSVFMLIPSGRWHHYFVDRKERHLGVGV